MTVQCTGIFGDLSKNARIHVQQRYKYDALDFYRDDIEWFSFCFIIIGIHLNGYSMLKKIQSGSLIWYNDAGVKVTDTSNGRINLITILVGRLIQLVIIS